MTTVLQAREAKLLTAGNANKNCFADLTINVTGLGCGGLLELFSKCARGLSNDVQLLR